jgi:hypothetical protein
LELEIFNEDVLDLDSKRIWMTYTLLLYFLKGSLEEGNMVELKLKPDSAKV